MQGVEQTMREVIEASQRFLQAHADALHRDRDMRVPERDEIGRLGREYLGAVAGYEAGLEPRARR